MADRTQRLAIVVTAQDLAAGKLKNVRAELAQMGTAGKLASIGLGGVMVVGNKAGQALGNLKSRLTSLAGPLGFIGVTAGLFSLTGAFEQGIAKASDMALAVEKVSGATGLAAHPASQLVAILEKFGIASDKVVTIAGFEEKALGKLSLTTTKGGASADQLAKANERLHLAEVKLHAIQTKSHSTAAQRLAASQRVADAQRHLTELQGKATTSTNKLDTIEKQYGITLSDTTGKVLPFMTVLNRVADYYKTSTDRAKAGALAAQVFGKGYVALIPVLELGSKGLAEAGAEADKMGLTLKSAQDVKNVHDFIAAQREAKDALAGMEVQLGLMAMPDLTGAFRGFTGLLASHQTEVKGFFTDMLHGAEGVASFITGTVVPTISGLVSVASGFWNAIPGPLRDWMVKGFVADRTIKFLFGMSPGHLVLQIAEGAIARGLGGAAGGFFGRGSPLNPMFVKNVGIPGLTPINPTSAVEDAGAVGMTSKIITGVVLGITAAAIIPPLTTPPVTDQNGQYMYPGEDPIFGPHGPLHFLAGGYDTVFGTNYGGTNPPGGAQSSAITTPPPFGFGNTERADMARSATALSATASTLTLLQQQLHADFADAIGALRKATDPAAIIAAAKRVTADMLRGVGNVGQTKGTIADLTAKRDALLAAGDKANAAIITAEIRKLFPFVAGRAHQAALLAQGQKIVASSQSTALKVADLHSIENMLLSEHRTSAAATIAHLIDIVNGVKALPPLIAAALPSMGNVTNIISGGGPGGETTPGKPAVTPKGGPPSHHKAAGGPVLPHHAYRVGEKGEETLVMGDQSGSIIPHAGKFAASMVYVTNWPTGGSGGGSAAPAVASAYASPASTKADAADQMKAALKAIDARAVAKGFHPTAALDKGTYDRDISRGFSMDRILRLLPGTQVNVNMSAADVQKARVVRSRIVKPHGSRGALVGVGG